MNDQQRAALARLFRSHAQFMADIPLLESMLDTYERSNQPPKDWRTMRDELRESDTYKATVAQFESIIQQLELSSDDIETIRLLQEISEGKPPN